MFCRYRLVWSSPDFTEFMENYRVYIIKSAKNGKYYIGSTSNLERRILDHNAGKVKSTKSGVPWEIVYNEIHITLSEARSRENQIKGWKKRIMIEKLVRGAFV